MGYRWDFLDHKTYNNKSGHYKFGLEYSFIMNNLIRKHDRILDIGGGSGRFALPLSNYCKKVIVIDINPDALEILRARNRTIETICGDFLEIKLSETFSFIIGIEVLGFFEDKNVFFKKVNSLLDNEGVFVFTFTNPNSWRFLLRRLGHLRTGTNNYHEISITDLKKILALNNFKILKMEGMNWVPLPLKTDNFLVNIFSGLEKFFQLKKWISQSPWIMVSIKKIS